MSMKIDDWEYHSRMLADIAKRNGGSLVMCYDPEPDKPTGKHALAIVGNGGNFMAIMATLIIEVASQTLSITPAKMSEEICKMIKFSDFMRENE